ncbi:MAG: DUF1553 domain-containing protein [Verrucomicrobia bacterium]|nr:DUF1553 domain-containing protein [Verrucomicrobiota bacterium]MBI3870108.1 DUF1553 domain-containing protein [Verrucomicrobiota bacterium]
MILALAASGEERGQGAFNHWSFQPVVRPSLPSISLPAGRQASPIDAFVAARLQAQGLALAPEADRRTLIRRLFLVMLGLPPSPERVRAFVHDPRPDAYERLVDEALADPAYGERWARHWLDVIRFAESNGFETNRERPNAWRFRDYVIQALNEDKPYDAFVREQIAGDALGVDVATGFLVGGAVDIVGSPDPVLTAQQRADQLDDMVATTSTAFLGLTLGCARCHDHKFDPLSQREYYSMSAIYSGVRHADRPIRSEGDPAKKERSDALKKRLSELDQERIELEPLATPAIAGRTNSIRRASVNARWNVDRFAPIRARRVRFTIREVAGGGQPCIDELEVFSGARNVASARAGAKATASSTLPGYAIHKLEHLIDDAYGNDHSWISDEAGGGWAEVEFAEPVVVDHVIWSRDRLRGFSDRVAARYLIEASLNPGEWVSVADGSDRRPPGVSGERDLESEIVALPPGQAERRRRVEAEQNKIRDELTALAQAPMAYAGAFSQPGETHLLHRGDPMQKKEIVPPATLRVFSPIIMSPDEPEQQRRLRLARWLADPANPLTPRVMVNRLWQHHFGVGLVDTPNDFGKNGSRPTHPELLDWLASEFMASGWSVKAAHRAILLSATWRQSSAPRPEGLRGDAADRLLWRYPPRRLEAESIRDSMLLITGALDRRAGGPSFHLHEVDRENVYHYHPKERFGSEEFRRMVYAYKVRMEQDGIFGAFDCPDGSQVAPRRASSTTPLQALNLFNSRFLQDQAELLCARLQREAPSGVDARIRRAWQLAYAREASQEELADALAFESEQGLPALARALLNSNELLFIP